MIQEHLRNLKFVPINRQNIEIIDKWTVERLIPRKKFKGPTLEILEKFHSICYFCGKKNNKTKHVDHIFPKSRGGSFSEDNVAIICSDCNQKKSNIILGEKFTYYTKKSVSELNSEPSLLCFYVFLRDNFICKTGDCKNGILNGNQILLTKKFDTGINSFENLITVCEKCK